LPLSVRRRQSACAWRIVRGYGVLRVFIVFLLVFIYDLFCFRVFIGRSFGQSAAEAWTVRGQADSPRAPRGQSDFTRIITGGSVAYFGQSVAQGRTVRRTCADSPPYLAGQSASGRQGWFFDQLLFDCFRFLSLGFLIASLGLVESCLGLWLHVWIRWSCDWGIGRIQPRGRIFIGSHSLPPLWSPSDPSISIRAWCRIRGDFNKS
jgi:hypothetical protein